MHANACLFINSTTFQSFPASWRPGTFSVMSVFMCVCLCASSKGRIPLKMPYLRSHRVWNPTAVELLAILKPQGFSLRWQLSSSASLKTVNIHQQQTLQRAAEAESWLSEIGCDFSEEALSSCSMTGSHENLSARCCDCCLELDPVKM